MAVVNTKSPILLNFDAVPRINTLPYLGGANDTICKAVITAAAGDSIGSTYRFGFIPSGVSLADIQMQNDAISSGTWNLGVYCNSQQGLNLGGPGYSVQTWSSTVAYVPGNVVLFNGIVYGCIVPNTNSQPPSGNWTTGGTSIASPGSVPIPNSPQIFATGISAAAANTTWKSIYSPTNLTALYTAGNTALRVWELLGMVQDPDYLFHLVMTATIAPSSGNIALQWSWVK
jgi:hypothetical protein